MSARFHRAPPLVLLAILIAGPCAGQDEAPATSSGAVELRRIPATEANQGVAADDRFLYVIDNRVIGKYDRVTGARVAGWEGAAGGPIHHLNAGLVREGRLYVAHSNYPDVPMVSSIEVWDARTLRHVASHSFGIHSGSATWIDFHDGSWWVGFANYDNRGGTPGKGVEWSTVERFDPDWRQTGAWVFPDSLVSRFRPYSNSGGFWSADGILYLTGHDAPEIYTLRLPEAGSTLQWTGTIPAPIEGQGIGRDPADPAIVYAIDRGSRDVIEVRLPASAARASGGADFVAIFDGRSLDGWEGDPTYWRVEDGSIVGEVTASTLLDRNSWLIWRGGVVRDFELRVEYRISAQGNSGIGYRTEEVADRPYGLRGYQADLDGRNRYTGMNYEELKRTTLASQGERVHIPPVADAGDLAKYVRANDWTPSVVDSVLGHPDSLDAHVRALDWNDYQIIARGNHMRHYVNGVLMSEVTDADTVNRSFEGLLGVQVHAGPPMKVEYRNFRLRRLDGG